MKPLRLVLTALVCFAASALHGMSPSPKPVIVAQPDGTKLELSAQGNAFVHWFTDKSGYSVVLDASKRYVYAALDAKGALAPTALEVGKADPAARGLQLGLKPAPAAVLGKMAALKAPLPGVAEPEQVPAAGTVKNLVILCRFSDHNLASHTRTQADFTTLFNTVGGHTTIAPTGSVKDYFTETSYGQMNLQSTVVAWVTLPNTEAYYGDGKNGTGGVYPKNAQGMVGDALALADPLVNFGDFDTDNDGFVDAITIIHSGYGAETGGGAGNWIWSHRWSLWALPGGRWTSLDNNGSGVKVKVEDYHTEPALWGTSGTQIVRIGVICHETGHFFGLPDLYDTDGTSRGIGSWCLMANSWGFDGTQLRPPHFSAWCKIQLGWVTPTVITSGSYTAGQVVTNPTIYKISNGFPSGEYLLVENRMPTGIETSVPTGGLAVWHIDDRKDGNDSEGYPGQAGWPGNNNHFQVALLQADGLYDLEKRNNSGDAGDLFRASGRNSINATTVPNTNSYQLGANTVTNNAITNISAHGASMTFDLNVTNGPPVINSSLTASGSPGVPFNYQISATNNPTSYSATGLPTGLGLNTSTGVISGNPTANGTSNVTIRATNAQGTGSATLVITIAPVQTIGTALDATSYTWVTGGTAPWLPQTTITRDGVDAIKSGAITDLRNSTVQTTIVGPATVSFWWKVSSEVNYDFLRFRWNGATQFSISGNVDWQQRTLSLPPGTHILMWEYSKDVSLSNGDDAGYVDQVTVTAGSTAPIITSATSASGIQGVPFNFQITATNTPTSYAATTLPLGLVLGTSSGLISGTPSVSGTFSIGLTASNSTGSGTATLSLSIAPTGSVTLATALDTTGITWVTSGAPNEPFYGQTAVTHDGVDAAQSGTTAAASTNSFEATVTGPGSVTFWWKVSSELTHDALRCYLDDAVVQSISGTVDWTQQTVILPAGSHTVRWAYTKDGSVNVGLDKGWVDEVVFTSSSAPIITSASAASGTVGDPFSYQITASNLPTSFAASSLPANLSLNTTTGIISGVPSTAGTFSIPISATNSNGSGTATLTLTIAEQVGIPLATALDTTGLVWTSAGTLPWVGQAVMTFDGVDAASSGDISDGQESYLETTVVGPGTLTFRWSTSSEVNYDLLTFLMDGVTQVSISGNSTWSLRTITVPTGTHTLRWRYSKDGSVSSGSDTGWVDQVTYIGAAIPEITSASVASGYAGSPFSYQIVATNNPTSYAASSLPAGLTINTSTGLISGTPSATGSEVASISAINANGTGTKALTITINALPTITLETALDLAGVSWITEGSALWTGQSSITRDGVSAGRSGAIGNAQFSAFSTTVTDMGSFSFWWKVSSENGFDFLSVEIDGVQQARISGNVDWQQRAFALPPGTHTVRWVYTKDGSVGAGADAGFVDQVAISVNGLPPSITSVLATQAPLNQPFSYQVTASNFPTSYAASGLPAGLSINTGTGLISGTPTASGTFNVTLSATNTEGTGSATLVLFVDYGFSLAQALDEDHVTWTSSGNRQWFGQSLVTRDGADAAASGDISNSETTYIETTVSGPASVAFWWSVSSEAGYDFLSFAMDGSDKAQISGNVAWQKKTFAIPAGSHTLRWSYRKDGSTSVGNDTGWIDEVAIATAPIVTQSPLNQLVAVNTPAVFTAQVSDSNLALQWERNRARFVGATSLNLAFLAQLSQAGAFRLKASNAIGTTYSDEAQLGVVDTSNTRHATALNALATIALLAEGNQLTFQWQKNGAPLADDGRITGTTTRTLSIRNATLDDAASYTCLVSQEGGLSLLSGTKALSIYTAMPQLGMVALPDGVVSGQYQYAIPYDTSGTLAPVSFTASPLPKGLVCDLSTGIIWGYPEVSGTTSVTIKATNFFGTATVTVPLIIEAMDSAVLGTFHGLIGRDDEINDGLGSRVILSIALNGKVTGKITTGVTTHSFSTWVTASLTENYVISGPVSKARPNDWFAMTFNTSSRSFTGEANGDTSIAAMTAAGTSWHASANPATSRVGLYNVLLDPDSTVTGNPAYPQGSGFGSFTIAPNGALTFAGRLADGSAFTSATFLTHADGLTFYQSLYKNQGSLLGSLTLTPHASTAPLGNMLTGEADWTRPGIPGRLYPAGFDGAQNLTLRGGRYVAPTSPTVIVTGSQNTGIGHLSFYEAGVELNDSPSPAPGFTTFNLQAPATALLPTGSANPTATTLSIKANSGAFSGRFTLRNGSLLRSNIAYQGLIIPIDADTPALGLGGGYFTLPQIPTTGQTLSTSPQLIGGVSIEAAP